MDNEYFDFIENIDDCSKINKKDYILYNNEIYKIKNKNYSVCKNIYYSATFMCKNIFTNEIDFIKFNLTKNFHKKTIIKNDTITKVILKKHNGCIIYIDDLGFDIMNNDNCNIIHIEKNNLIKLNEIKLNDDIIYINYKTYYKIVDYI
jgi:translation elongation factor P/translation initiation factor 5A